MASKEYMPINTQVLRWARETAGYSIEAAQSISMKYPEWEEGNLKPTYTQLESISAKFKSPSVLFFFPEPSDEDTIDRSLRTMANNELLEIIPTIRCLFSKAKAFQLNLEDIFSTSLAEQKRKVSWVNNINTKNVNQLVVNARDAIGISFETQKEWKNSDLAFREWRKALAGGVLCDAFKSDAVAGFCIYSDLFPIIYINNSQTSNRKIFTLFHELSHLLLQSSYLDVFNNYYFRIEQDFPNHEEVICNKFATHFLLPDNAPEIVNIGDISDNKLSEIAKIYSVSREVILRLLKEIGLIDNNYYMTKIQQWRDEW